VDDTVSTSEATPVTIAVVANDSDPNGDALTLATITPAANGTTESATATALTYTPASGFSGTDTFTYTIQDPSGATASATVTVTVTPVTTAPPPNAPPLAIADTVNTLEATPVTIPALTNDSDPDGDVLLLTAVTPGSHGMAVATPEGTLTYTPTSGFSGTDTFTYTVSDGQGGTATGTVTVTITAVNDAPQAVADTATTAEDTAVTIAVLANDQDVDGGSLQVTGITAGSHGAATVHADGTLTYTPETNFTGTDTFTYTVSDGQGGTATGTVTVTVTPDPPPAITLTAPTAGSSITEGMTFTLRADASDDIGIVQVDFLLDGLAAGTVQTAPYEVTVQLPYGPDGSAVLIQAIATDTDGQTSQTTVQVTRLRETVPPTVTMTMPRNGAILALGPSDVAIIINTSDSTLSSCGVDVDGDNVDDNLLACEIVAAKTLLDLLDPTVSHVAVVAYSSSALLVQPLTNDFMLVQQAMDTILATPVGSGTNFSAAMQVATDELVSLRARQLATPVQILLSNEAAAFPVAEVTRAANGHVIVHTFGVGSGAEHTVLEQIATETGGMFTPVANPADLVEILPGIALFDGNGLVGNADATDNDAVSQVAFRFTSTDSTIDTTLADTTPPFATLFSIPSLTQPLALTIVATAHDFSDNETASAPVNATVLPAPNAIQIASLTQVLGAPGDIVDISGSFFAPLATDNIVTFNGVPAMVLNGSKIRLQVSVPAGAGSGPVAIQSAGLSSNTVAFAFDTDRDGLTDEEEQTLGTNPGDADTDDGGRNDGTEVNTDHTDPLNPNDDLVSLPRVLVDGSNFQWDVQRNGNINNGTSDAYDGGLRLSVNGVSFGNFSLAANEDARRELRLGPFAVENLRVTRKIFVPTTAAFARFLEIIENPSPDIVRAIVMVSTNLGSDSGTMLVNTSSGDTTFNTADDFIITDDFSNGSGDPTLAHVFVGPNAAFRPTAVSLGGDNLSFTFDVMIPGDDRMIIMHFASQNTNRAVAATSATQLHDLTGDTLTGLTPEELQDIINVERLICRAGIRLPAVCARIQPHDG
jgi:hypothetical protein